MSLKIQAMFKCQSLTVISDLHLPLQRASPGLSHLCIWLFCLSSLITSVCLPLPVCVSLSCSVLRVIQAGFKPDAQLKMTLDFHSSASTSTSQVLRLWVCSSTCGLCKAGMEPRASYVLANSILLHPQLPSDFSNRHDADILRQHLVPCFRSVYLFLDAKDFLGQPPSLPMCTYTWIKSELKTAQIWRLKPCMSRDFTVAKKKKKENIGFISYKL